MTKELNVLKKKISNCQICSEFFLHIPRPIFQLSSKATILIAGQAPGRKVHESGIPFADPSGDRLRNWMGVSKAEFYDSNKIAILPMGFCYPGKGKSGDLPPRQECALTWRNKTLKLMPKVQLTLVIGSYAIKWHLGKSMKNNLTETVRAWDTYPSNIIPLPHPSPRNNIWLSKHSWFESEVLPAMREKIQCALKWRPRADSNG